MRWITLMILALALLSTPRARAAHEFPVEVVQPIITEEGVFPRTVCYTLYRGGPVPGWSVSLVSKESCVITELGDHSNRNAANRLGVRTGVDSFHSSGKLYGDTMRVWVDFSQLEEDQVVHRGQPITRVVNATIEAVIATAYKSRRGWDSEAEESIYANYVAIEVRGKPEYRELSQVVSFEQWLAAKPLR
jgi:hypothetical protein